jgi:hypothetical protein
VSLTRIGVSVQVRTNQKGRRAVTGVASESDDQFKLCEAVHMRRCNTEENGEMPPRIEP